MDYRIEQKDAFDVLAVTKTFGQENSYREIPLFWDEYFERGLQKKVCPGLGICHQAPSGGPYFLYSIGDECEKDAPVPEGFERITIPAHTWAAFPCVGPMPKAIQDMWTRVYSEWLPESEYVLVPDYDMEVYSAGDAASAGYRTEIWIPSKRSSAETVFRRGRPVGSSPFSVPFRKAAPYRVVQHGLHVVDVVGLRKDDGAVSDRAAHLDHDEQQLEHVLARAPRHRRVHAHSSISRFNWLSCSSESCSRTKGQEKFLSTSFKTSGFLRKYSMM